MDLPSLVDGAMISPTPGCAQANVLIAKSGCHMRRGLRWINNGAAQAVTFAQTA